MHVCRCSLIPAWLTDKLYRATRVRIFESPTRQLLLLLTHFEMRVRNSEHLVRQLLRLLLHWMPMHLMSWALTMANGIYSLCFACALLWLRVGIGLVLAQKKQQ